MVDVRVFSIIGLYLCKSLPVDLRQSASIITACIQALSTDVHIPADNAFSALETISLFNYLYKCSHLVSLKLFNAASHYFYTKIYCLFTSPTSKTIPPNSTENRPWLRATQLRLLTSQAVFCY